MKTLKITKLRKLVWLLTLVLISASIPVSVEAHNNFAPLQDSAPTGTGTFLYIPEAWQVTPTDPPIIDPMGNPRTIAYQKGSQVPFTASNPTIILDFGRQVLAPSGNWGVYLTPEDIKHSMLWVHNVAQDFIDGYNDSPNHPRAFIAVGTNNSNYAWACGSNYASIMWDTAGDQWGQLVQGLTPRSKVTVKSANDIEAFFLTGDSGPWTACGSGIGLWFDGYQRETAISNYDFGDNAWGDNNVLWSEDQIYQAVFGRITAYAFPQVYCSGSFWDASWIPVRRDYNMFFLGVTSLDGSKGPDNCGIPSLYWQQSWNKLNNTLTSANPNYNPPYPGYANSVGSQAITFWRNP